MKFKVMYLALLMSGFVTNQLAYADSSIALAEEDFFQSSPDSEIHTRTHTITGTISDSKTTEKSEAKPEKHAPPEGKVEQANVVDLYDLLAGSPIEQTNATSFAVNEDWLYGSEIQPEHLSGRIPSKPNMSTAMTRPSDEIRLNPPNFSLDTATIDLNLNVRGRDERNQSLINPYPRNGVPSIVARSNTDFGYSTLGFGLSGFKIKENEFWVDGFFKWNFLDGPTTARVDSQAYILGVSLNRIWRINEETKIQTNLTPLYSSDFNNHSSDSFRLVGGGVMSYDAEDWLQIVAGVTFLDRKDLPALPIFGARLNFDDLLEIDLIIPRPRIAFRVGGGGESEVWSYVGGDVGGESWAIRREFGLNDRMGYRDYRIVIGTEFRDLKSGTFHGFEAGYVFNRKLDMQRWGGSQSLQDTFVLQWGTRY